MNTEIEELFGGENAEEQNALLHVIKERGYDFLENTPVTTMTVRLLEDLYKLGYKLVKNNDLLNSVSGCFPSEEDIEVMADKNPLNDPYESYMDGAFECANFIKEKLNNR